MDGTELPTDLLQTLLEDFHVEDPQETTPEALPQSDGLILLNCHTRIHEQKLRDRIPQSLEITAVRRIQATEHLCCKAEQKREE